MSYVVKDERIGAWTFRPEPDVEKLAEEARIALGWSKAHLINEALRIAVPILVDQTRARLNSLAEGVDGARAAAKRAVERAAKRGGVAGG